MKAARLQQMANSGVNWVNIASLSTAGVNWDGLNAEDQKAIRQAAKESVPYMRKLWDEREEKSLATVKAGGAEIITVDKASFQNAMKPVYDKFITDAKLKDLVKRIQETK